MAKSFKNWKELSKRVERKAKVSLEKNVYPIVEETIQHQIMEVVYDPYENVPYSEGGHVRTYDFYQSNNIFKNVQGDFKTPSSSIQMSVQHLALTIGGEDLSMLIMLGQDGARAYGSGIAKYDDKGIRGVKNRYKTGRKTMDETPFWEPRNFMATSKIAIQADKKKVVEAFKKGMK